MVSVMKSHNIESHRISRNATALKTWNNSSVRGSPALFTTNSTPASKNSSTIQSKLLKKPTTIPELLPPKNDSQNLEGTLMSSSTAYIEFPWTLIKSKDVTKLEEWLKTSSSEVNNLNPELGLGLLHISAAKGMLEFCKTLLKHGADPKLKSRKGCGVIHLAARHGAQNVLELLLDFEPSLIGEISSDGWGCLHEAISNGKHSVIQFLAEKGADINRPMRDKLETPLMTAIKTGNIQTIETVLSLNPNLDLQNSSGLTALILACGSGHKSEVFTKLLDQGADLKLTSNRGASCAHIAARNGQIDILKIIMQKEASLLLGKTDDNWNPLHEAADSDQSDVIQFLLAETSLLIDEQTSTGNTALHLAARKCNLNALSALCTQCKELPDLVLRNKNRQTVSDVLEAHPKSNEIAWKMKEIIRSLGPKFEPEKVKASSSKSKNKAVSAGFDPGTSEVSKSVDVFLSYSWADGILVDQIYGKLTQKCFHVWQDKQKIGPGDNLYGKIQEGVQSCKVFVPCLTESYLNSANARSEFHLAKLWNKKIIPLILDRNLTKKWPPVSELAPLLAPLVYLVVTDDKNELILTEVGKLCSRISATEIDHSI